MKCGCGHAAHGEKQCPEWRRYPEVLDARQCGCLATWKPRVDTATPMPYRSNYTPN